MTRRRKRDSKAIEAFLDDLKSQAWLMKARSWWPSYLFRFENVEAAAAILNAGSLLSRHEAETTQTLLKDCASPEVISGTAAEWKKHVRLYFRPRTPTQFHAEGIRTRDKYGLGSHCPVPVVFLFDSKDLLTREEALFSAGTLAAAGAVVGDDAAFLQKIPFRDVYHDTPFQWHERDRIIYHRHAEVVFPKQLDLDGLKRIFCRSPAEYRTLLNLLDPMTAVKWNRIIGLGSKARVHFATWTYVEEGDLQSDKARLRFNPSTAAPGPFDARISIVDESATRYTWADDSYMAKDVLTLDVTNLEVPASYELTLMLNGDLVFKDKHDELDVPF